MSGRCPRLAEVRGAASPHPPDGRHFSIPPNGGRDRIAAASDGSAASDWGDEGPDGGPGAFEISRRTFYRWRELGRAPVCLQLPNDELRVWRSDLMAWLDSLRRAA